MGILGDSINNAMPDILTKTELRYRIRHSLNQHWCGVGAQTADSHVLTKLWTPELQPHPGSVFLSSVMKSASTEKAIAPAFSVP